MKAAPFEYARAASLEEACTLLAQHGHDARLIAGGQSLVPMMAMRLVRPALLVDVNRIADLKTITTRNGYEVTAACARQQRVKEDERLAARVPLLRQALEWVGHVQTRNRGTVGGSLVHADPSAELPLAAQVLQANIVVRSSTGTRTIVARDFFAGPMETSIAPHELTTEIEWPVWEGRIGSAFEEVSRRHGDFAIVAAAAQLELDREGRCVRAAFGLAGVDGIALAFPDLAAGLVGSELSAAQIEAVAHSAASELTPGNDLHASAEYRRHLARVLLTRVLAQARERALASGR